MNTNIIAQPADAPLVPIYSESDPRWPALLEWLESNRHNAGQIADLSPTERAAWFEIYVNGADVRETGRRDVAYPSIPAQPRPAWATGCEDVGCDIQDRPERLWSGNLSENVRCSVELTRTDLFDPVADAIVQGNVEARLWIDGNQHESGIPNPAALREIALTLYDAATRWDAALAVQPDVV